MIRKNAPEPAATATAGESLKPRTRDRSATEARILDAAQAILTETGPAGFGVNAVARAAGTDKQLIYRYFGGLDGLLEALGDRIAVWWQQVMRDEAPGPPPADYAALIERMTLRLLHILRTEPLALQSALWELTDTSGLVRALSASRSRALGAWMETTRGDLKPPEGVDAPAVNAMIIAALSYLVLASRTSDTVIGLPTDHPETWRRIEDAVTKLVRTAYGSG
ncbi:TetR/AcrR family transcriptional regulator [Mongoliimonas terrestris]|uniref:TetR/AcrR family transcriptional regulator n=1 Tax=Mongoliimonas terrestris TaxID=1709001 RepID=UPI000949533A|nr:TetR/AcrR family transcriptional regulator [Mongoliimonas terrestris]